MYEKYDEIEEWETLCKLEDGTIMPYDAAHSTDEQVYSPLVYEFIGTGYIYSINGVLQDSKTKDWFYRRID